MITHDSPANLPAEQDIEDAVQHLLRGGLVAFPTETVYGLGADAENPDAIARIYAAKERPVNHPLIVHLAHGVDPEYWTGALSAQTKALMAAFWPGPLTLIVPRAAHIPAAVSGGQPTIGLRCPAHPVAQALLSRFAQRKSNGQGGLAAPSANKFGHVSPTRAEHVREEFAGMPSSQLRVLDGGASVVGIESTILDVSEAGQAAPVLLRPGHISSGQIADVLGVVPGRPHHASPQVSGTLKAHYAPHTPLRLFSPSRLREAVAAYGARPTSGESPRIALVGFQPPLEGKPIYADYLRCPDDPVIYARELYNMLRRLDAQAYDEIWIEQPPQLPAWQAVNDRLGRAAAAFGA